MRARRVIHTVGPVWGGGGQGEAAVLASAYRASLRVAHAEGLRTVAFPSISTGIYGYPVDAAAEVALATVCRSAGAPNSFHEVRFVLFDARTLDAFRAALERLTLRGEG